MKKITRKIRNLKALLFFVSFCKGLASGVIVLLLFMLGFIFFSIPWYYALIPAVIFMFLSIRKTFKKAGLADIEKNVPELEWQLRTAADNVDRDDELVQDLNTSVLEKLGLVKGGKLLKDKRTLAKAFSILCLAALIFTVSFFNFDATYVGNAVKETDLADFVQNSLGNLGGEGQATFIGQDAPDDIYGESSYLESNGEEVDLEFNTLGGVVDTDNFNRDGESQDFEGKSELPLDAGASADSAFTKTIDDKNKEIVANYFNQINE